MVGAWTPRLSGSRWLRWREGSRWRLLGSRRVPANSVGTVGLDRQGSGDGDPIVVDAKAAVETPVHLDPGSRIGRSATIGGGVDQMPAEAGPVVICHHPPVPVTA